MNAIQFLPSQPWLEHLGWTLVHFLWQGVLISSLYAASRKWLIRSSNPNAHYNLACLAIAIMMVVPFLTFGVMNRPGSLGVSDRPAMRITAVASAVINTLPAKSMTLLLDRPTASVASSGLLTWVVFIWVAGVVAFCVRLMGGWVVAARMRKIMIRPAPLKWQQTLNDLKSRIHVSQPVRLLLSSLVEVPTVVGWLRPVVLVPIGALTGLPPEHVEALLLHELAHIRRHDYLVNLLQSVTEALLFYHPAVWWVSGHIRIERELCCDDMAVSVSGDVLTYTRALAELELYRPHQLKMGIAASGGSLVDRIRRLLWQSTPVSSLVSRSGAAVSVIVLAIATCALFGQSAASPRFEVASIKLNSGCHGSIQRGGGPGSLSLECITVRQLIQGAYSIFVNDVNPQIALTPISGGPDWLNSEYYDVHAKAEGGASFAHMAGTLTQTLLEDRFRLKLHRETKELPVYFLTIAKGGSKLQRTKDGSCTPLDFNHPPPAPGQTGPNVCGMTLGGGRKHGLTWTTDVQGTTMALLIAGLLHNYVDRPVIDKTGLAGLFDYHLEFVGDTIQGPRGSGGQGELGATVLSSDTVGPSLFTALQEQLGLKLVSAKGPVEVLVIDHIERPSEN